MGWAKQTFKDFVTVITAKFLNDLQDQIVEDETTLSKKVNAVEGKGLSANDYTDEEKTKLKGIEAKAQANVKSDWNAASGDAQILNKPGEATATKAGFMSASDKSKLDALPKATDLSADLNKKLDKLTTSGDKVYTHSGSTQGEKTVTATPTAGAVPLYGTGGRLKAAVPSADDDVLRKKELDNLAKDIKAGTEATAAYHLGFYLDENGDLVQVD